MNLFFYLVGIVMVVFSSCASSERKTFVSYEIKSRDGIVTYQCSAPESWMAILPDPDVDLNDSTLPLISWKIDDAIVVVFHNFPGQAIPPKAQTVRWEKQLKNADPAATSLEQVAWGGFEGLKLEIGDIEDHNILGWALTMPAFHRYAFQNGAREQHLTADWTLKVTGPSSLIREHHEELDTFAQSFRLKREIP